MSKVTQPLVTQPAFKLGNECPETIFLVTCGGLQIRVQTVFLSVSEDLDCDCTSFHQEGKSCPGQCGSVGCSVVL